MMLGFPPPLFFQICWRFISPAIIFVSIATMGHWAVGGAGEELAWVRSSLWHSLESAGLRRAGKGRAGKLWGHRESWLFPTG